MAIEKRKNDFEVPLKKMGLQSLMLKLGVNTLALSSKYSNDADLGKAIRQLVGDLNFKARIDTSSKK